MKIIRYLVVLLMVLSLFLSCKKDNNETKTDVSNSKYKDLKSQVSYVIGYDIGQNMREGDIEIDTDIILEGLVHAYKDKDSEITEEEKEKIMEKFRAEMKRKQEEKNKKTIEEGKKYLEKNKKKKGVIVLESGLQYKVIKEGTGPSPKPGDMVKTHYTGKLVDGTVFDSTEERGEPATFPVTAVIQGWQEALQLMKIGSKWQLVIPPELGYGERGAGGKIPPNAVLIFEMELLSIEKK